MSDDDVVRDAGGRPDPAGRPGGSGAAGGGVQWDHLRRIAVLLETAAVLDRRATRTADAVHADVLRERAAQRRETAAQLRAGVWAPERHVAG
ncbi:hypothetical protein [Modestobacter excelsi]|uniref:hypothetical protein n=1 Tax=Modestobacter excelsi TaxID=2213161 RepID=UPI00110CF2B5|nr:hypothetical protein [Modestobacter excelsi]